MIRIHVPPIPARTITYWAADLREPVTFARGEWSPGSRSPVPGPHLRLEGFPATLQIQRVLAHLALDLVEAAAPLAPASSQLAAVLLSRPFRHRPIHLVPRSCQLAPVRSCVLAVAASAPAPAAVSLEQTPLVRDPQCRTPPPWSPLLESYPPLPSSTDIGFPTSNSKLGRRRRRQLGLEGAPLDGLRVRPTAGALLERHAARGPQAQVDGVDASPREPELLDLLAPAGHPRRADVQHEGAPDGLEALLQLL